MERLTPKVLFDLYTLMTEEDSSCYAKARPW